MKFSGDKSKETKYLVYNTESLTKPAVKLSNPDASINDGNAQYLIISHPDFIGGLDELANERQKTFSVKVVDVNDIYDLYSFGIFDPEAIKSYIKYAAQNLGTEYVLLVGNDTYDYFDYLGIGSVSFIPTLYAKTHKVVNYSPADGLFADLDNDNVQDLAIGRFPVRTSDELQYIINKTLNFPSASHDKKAVFVADIDDGSFSFSNASDVIIQNLPVEWKIDTVYLEDFDSANQAKSKLIQMLNEGREFTSFIGHSGPSVWGTQNIFDTGNAAALTNYDDPTVVMQGGCWNSYFVQPSLNTLSHKFLLSGENGAVVVLGPTSLTLAANNISIAKLISEKLLVDGLTVGYALNDAKQDIAASGIISRLDVILGWHLLGDPALIVEP